MRLLAGRAKLPEAHARVVALARRTDGARDVVAPGPRTPAMSPPRCSTCGSTGGVSPYASGGTLGDRAGPVRRDRSAAWNGTRSWPHPGEVGCATETDDGRSIIALAGRIEHVGAAISVGAAEVVARSRSSGCQFARGSPGPPVSASRARCASPPGTFFPSSFYAVQSNTHVGGAAASSVGASTYNSRPTCEYAQAVSLRPAARGPPR